MHSLSRFVLVAAVLAMPSPVPGQPPDVSLRVRVVDDTGGVIIGAQVSVTQAGGPARVVATGNRGEALVEGLVAGAAGIRVEAPGFEARVITGHRLRTGSSRLDVTLRVEKLSVTIDVSRDAREKQLDPRGDAFTRLLTQDMIAQLPDDPDELERVLTQMAGPGATFRVNGFGGSRLPSKAQIRSIRISFSSFSAELHELGMPIVDIQTQPGLDRWRVSSTAVFRNDALTARYPYAPLTASEEVQRGGISVDGPVRRNRTSLSFNADGAFLADAQTILASVPGGTIPGAVKRPTDRRTFSLELEHALTKTHISRLEVSGTRTAIENLGVGGTNLPERAYSTDQATYTVRLSDQGSIGKRLFNQFRLQNVWNDLRTDSVTPKPAIIVLDAFSMGGAQVKSARRSWEVEAADDLDFARGRHAMRAGVILQAAQYRSTDQGNVLGSFTFSGLEDYEAGRPATFTQRVGDPLVEFGFYRLGWYFQDDMKAHKTLTVSLGLRQESQSQIDDAFNLSPRFGATWAPIPNGKLTLRGGIGLVYNWFDASLYEQTLRVDGQRQFDIIVSNPGFPDPLSGVEPVVLPPSRYLQSPTLHLPRILLWSVAVERRFRLSATLQANYTRQQGARVFRGRNLNAPLPGGVRPFPEFGNVTQVESTARSVVDRLTVGFSHVLLKNGRTGLVASVTYVLARQLNDTDGAFSVPSDSWNPQADWGPASGDRRHTGTIVVMGTLPRGFRASVIATALSAPPYNITTGFDDNQDTVIKDRPPGVGRNSARGSAQADLMVRVGWGTGVGKAPAPDGPAAINTRRLGTAAERDMLGAMGAAFGAVSHRYRVEFFAQVYNALNRINPIGYRGVLTSPYFGQSTASLAPRRVELGVRFDY